MLVLCVISILRVRVWRAAAAAAAEDDEPEDEDGGDEEDDDDDGPKQKKSKKGDAESQYVLICRSRVLPACMHVIRTAARA